MTNESSFGSFLDEVDGDALEETIQSLEAYEDSFSKDSVIPGSAALINRIGNIPKRPSRGMFDFNRPDLIVTRVVLRLIRSLKEEINRDAAVSEIYSRLDSFSAKYTLIHLVGYDENAGHKLVSASKETELLDQLTQEIRAQGVEHPEKEWEALRLYYWLAEREEDGYIAPDPASVPLTRELFTSARSERKSQGWDTRAVRIDEVLAWEVLIKVFGTEDAVREAFEALQQSDGDTDLVKLIARYVVEGWRPKAFASDEEEDE